MKRALFLSILPILLPGLGLIAQAQVLVNKEPRHHPVFYNGEIRVLNVLIPPHDTTLYHKHHTPSFFIQLSNTQTGSQLKGQEPSLGNTQSGIIYFENLAYPNERIHRVWNLDQDTMHVVDVELLKSQYSLDKDPIKEKNLNLAVDTSGIRAYRLLLNAGETFHIQAKKRQVLLISIHSSEIRTNQKGNQPKQVKAGTFFNLQKTKFFSLTNSGSNPCEFVLLEY